MADNPASLTDKRNPFCDIPGCDCQNGPPIERCDECQAAVPHHTPACSRYVPNRGYGAQVIVPASDAPAPPREDDEDREGYRPLNEDELTDAELRAASPAQEATPRKPFKIAVSDKDRFAAALGALPEEPGVLAAGALTESRCNCASTSPTMPTYRALTDHLPSCPAFRPAQEATPPREQDQGWTKNDQPQEPGLPSEGECPRCHGLIVAPEYLPAFPSPGMNLAGFCWCKR